MSSIKNVAIAGATGNLGSVLTQQVIASGKFNVTILKRAGSTAVYPDSAKVVEVDYTSTASLEAALAGQDAVVSALATLAAETQIPLIDAAVAAGVKRFLPSEFGSKLDNPNTRQIPILAAKVQIEEYLKTKAQSSDLSYTFVYTGVFLDWALQHKFILDLTTEKPRVVDGGDLRFSSTSLSTIGDAVVGVLLHPEETKNRVVHVHDLVISQNKLLALARQAYPDKKWEPESVALSDLFAKAGDNASKGVFDGETIYGFLIQGVMNPDYGCVFEENDNELLGIKPKGEDFILETIKSILG